MRLGYDVPRLTISIAFRLRGPPKTKRELNWIGSRTWDHFRSKILRDDEERTGIRHWFTLATQSIIWCLVKGYKVRFLCFALRLLAKESFDVLVFGCVNLPVELLFSRAFECDGLLDLVVRRAS